MSDGTQLFLRGRQVLRTQLADVDRLCDLVWKHIADGTAHRLNWQAIVQSADPPLPWNAKFVLPSPSTPRQACTHALSHAAQRLPSDLEVPRIRLGAREHGRRQPCILHPTTHTHHSSTATDHRHPACERHYRASQRWTGRRATWRTRHTCST